MRDFVSGFLTQAVLSLNELIRGFPIGGGSSAIALRTVRIPLTSAQILALNATNIPVVSAPGAGRVILPLLIAFNFTYGGIQYTSGGPGGGAQLQYGAQAAGGGVMIPNTDVSSYICNSISNSLSLGVSFTLPQLLPVNQPVQLTGSVTLSSGNGTGVLTVVYLVVNA